ncbi:helix-turn-helix domain-containing protein [Streptomyces sirii]|uniref:helix-turn-helix domain-containing protein n=1 Tax=Streptomyces sirii TaxID=3127701 RepID=UPI003D369A00
MDARPEGRHGPLAIHVRSSRPCHARRSRKPSCKSEPEHRLRVRAQVVLHAACGRSNACIARETGLHVDTVRRWRGRFTQAGLPGLKDRRRCGAADHNEESSVAPAA